MKIPSPGSACSELLTKLIGVSARQLTEENFDHYSRIRIEGSPSVNLAESVAQSIMPKNDAVLEGDMAAFLALELITNELTAMTFDVGSPSSEVLECHILSELESLEPNLHKLCWEEVKRSEGWEYIKESRTSLEFETVQEKYFMERDGVKVLIDDVDREISEALIKLIDNWVDKLRKHLQASITKEQWANAYDLPIDDENLATILDGAIGLKIDL
jgi:hypothetical protein